MCIYNFLHSFSPTYLGSGHSGSRLMFWLLWEDPGAFLDQMGHIICPENSGSTPGSPPCRTCPEILKTEVPFIRRPNQVVPLMMQRRLSSKPLSPSLRWSPGSLGTGLILAACVGELILSVAPKSHDHEEETVSR